MSISGIRTALAASLDDITTLTVYDNVPDSINSFPAVYFDIDTINYHQDAGGDQKDTIEIVLLSGRADGITSANVKLDTYLEKSGTSSIMAYAEAASFTTHAAAFIVKDFRRSKGGERIGGELYSGGRFRCEFIAL